MLAVQAEKQLGEFAVNVSFTSDTAATALFGPSGAGKTSVINMIAGLLKPERGRIVLGDEVLLTASPVSMCPLGGGASAMSSRKAGCFHISR